MLGMSPLQFIQIALEKPELAAQYMAAQGKPPPPLQTMAEMPGQPPLQTIPAMPQMQTIPAMPEPRMVDQMLPMPMQAPPPTEAPTGNFAQSLVPENALPAMGDVPTVPPGTQLGPDGTPLSPLVQAIMGQLTGGVAGAGVGAALAPGTGERGPSGGQPYGVPAAPVPQPPMVAGPQVTPAGQPQLPGLPAPTQIGALPVPPASVPVAATAPVPAAASPGGPPTTPAAGPGTPMEALAQSLMGLAAPSGASGGAGRVAQAPAPYIQGALAPGTAAILQQIIQAAAQGPGQLNLRG